MNDGTELVIDRAEEGSTVTVIEGQVEVTTAEGQTLAVAEGQQVSLPGGAFALPVADGTYYIAAVMAPETRRLLELVREAGEEELEEAVALDRAEVREYVRAGFLRDEAKALGFVKPFNGSCGCCHS